MDTINYSFLHFLITCGQGKDVHLIDKSWLVHPETRHPVYMHIEPGTKVRKFPTGLLDGLEEKPNTSNHLLPLSWRTIHSQKVANISMVHCTSL